MAERCRAVEPLLSAYLDGEVDVAERAAVEAHLGRCRRCAHDLDELRSARTMLRSMPIRRLPAGVWEWPVSTTQPDEYDRRARRGRLVATAVVVLVVIASIAGVFSPPEQRRSVAVPVDLFVADHVARVSGSGVPAPVLVEAPSP